MSTHQRHVVLLFDLHAIIQCASDTDGEFCSRSAAIVRRLMCATYRLLIANSVLPVRNRCERWGFYLLDVARSRPCVARRRFHECSVDSLRALQMALKSAVERAFCSSPPRRGGGGGAVLHALQDVVSYFQWDQFIVCSPVKRPSRARALAQSSLPSTSAPAATHSLKDNVIYVLTGGGDFCRTSPYVNSVAVSGESAAGSGSPAVIEWLSRASVRRLLCDTHGVAVAVVDCGHDHQRALSRKISASAELEVLSLDDLLSPEVCCVSTHVTPMHNAHDDDVTRQKCQSDRMLEENEGTTDNASEISLKVFAKTPMANVDMSRFTRVKTIQQSSLQPDFAYLVAVQNSSEIFICVVECITDASCSYGAALYRCNADEPPQASSSHLSLSCPPTPPASHVSLSGELISLTHPSSSCATAAAADKPDNCTTAMDTGRDTSAAQTNDDEDSECPLPSLMSYMLESWFVNVTGDRLCGNIGTRRANLNETTIDMVLESDAHITSRRTPTKHARKNHANPQQQQQQQHRVRRRRRRSSSHSPRKRARHNDNNNINNSRSSNAINEGRLASAVQRGESGAGGGRATNRKSFRRGEQAVWLARRNSSNNNNNNKNNNNTATVDAKKLMTSSDDSGAATSTGGEKLNYENLPSDQLISMLTSLKCRCVEGSDSIVQCVQVVINTLLQHLRSQNDSAGCVREGLMDLLSSHFLSSKMDGEVVLRELMFQVVLLIEANWVLGGTASDVELDKIVSLLRRTSLTGGHSVFADFMNNVLVANYQLTQPDVLVNIYLEMGQSPPQSLLGSVVTGDSCYSTRPPSTTLSSLNEHSVMSSVSSGHRVRSSQTLSRQNSCLELTRKRQILVPPVASSSGTTSMSGGDSGSFGRTRSRRTAANSDCQTAGKSARHKKCGKSGAESIGVVQTSANTISGCSSVTDVTSRLSHVSPTSPSLRPAACFVPETPSALSHVASHAARASATCNTSVVAESPCRAVSVAALTPRRVSRRLALTRRSSFYGCTSSTDGSGGGELESRLRRDMIAARLNRSLPVEQQQTWTSNSTATPAGTSFPVHALFPSLLASPQRPAAGSEVVSSPARHVQFQLTPLKSAAARQASSTTVGDNVCVTPRSILKSPVGGFDRSLKRQLFSPELFGGSPHAQKRQSPRLVKRKRLFSGSSASKASVISGDHVESSQPTMTDGAGDLASSRLDVEAKSDELTASMDWLRRSPRLARKRSLFGVSSCRRDLSGLFSSPRPSASQPNPIALSSAANTADQECSTVVQSEVDSCVELALPSLSCTQPVMGEVDFNQVATATDSQILMYEIPAPQHDEQDQTGSNWKQNQTGSNWKQDQTGSNWKQDQTGPLDLSSTGCDARQTQPEPCSSGARHFELIASRSPSKLALRSWGQTAPVDLTSSPATANKTASTGAARTLSALFESSLSVDERSDVPPSSAHVPSVHVTVSPTGSDDALPAAALHSGRISPEQTQGAATQPDMQMTTPTARAATPLVSSRDHHTTPSSVRQNHSSFTPPSAFSLLDLACSPIINPVCSTRRLRSLRSQNSSNSNNAGCQLRCRRSLADDC